jgi:cation diffusion facilitator family transporter
MMMDPLATHPARSSPMVAESGPGPVPELTGFVPDGLQRGARYALVGLVVNVVLVIVKISAGLLGSSYALVADGVESGTDVFASLIVWRGLNVARKEADPDYHFGYGKAETIAAAAVSLILLAAAAGIAWNALLEIQTPGPVPQPFTLLVLVSVIFVKEVMFRKVAAAGDGADSRALKTDAWHHRSDAITSAAAFVGISLALVGGETWAPADDWAALLGSVIIATNGLRLLRPAVLDLMDRAPDQAVLDRVRGLAAAVEGVRGVEKVQARRAGVGYLVAIHVEADPTMTLRDAHKLGGRVRSSIRRDRSILDALVHMEPHEPEA